MGFNLIYWNPMGSCYFWLGSNLEKYGRFWKNGCFSGRIPPDWGNTAPADIAGLGSIGSKHSDSVMSILKWIVLLRLLNCIGKQNCNLYAL